MSLKPPRIGLVGAGAIAQHHLEGFRAAGCEVVAVADPFEAACGKFATAYNVTPYSDLTAMRSKEKLDAVSVCAPNTLHAPLTIEALSNGLNVMCEKPPSTNLGDVLKMRKAARDSGKLLMMGFNMRFDATSQEVARLRDVGALGEIYHARTSVIRRRRPGPWS
jgi:UDP-N-acetylglucosamine 3-dehydrogenase